MFIGGLQKFTLLDYPGKITAAVFTMGCNFRCQYCHNTEIVNPKLIDYENKIEEEEILKFLASRKGDLDGVCITGGEPTLQSGLMEFMRKIKELGFLVKLDTNASHPAIINGIIDGKLVDYWAIDIKTSPAKYKILAMGYDISERIERSLDLIAKSGDEFELRTTVAPGYVMEEDFDSIAEWINSVNPDIFQKLSRYAIQNFRPQKTLHKGFERVVPYTSDKLEIFADKLKKYCRNVVIVN